MISVLKVWGRAHLQCICLNKGVLMVEGTISGTSVFLPSEHVCNWLVGVEGNQKSTATNGQMFQQHHRAVQGQAVGHILFLSLSSTLNNNHLYM